MTDVLCETISLHQLADSANIHLKDATLRLHLTVLGKMPGAVALPAEAK